VVVTGSGDKTSDRAVRNIEKNSAMVQNILSEKTIQLLPDVTVANALQRVSGVNIQRDNTGEGRYAIIRGMDQRYNNTLVNGIKIPSPDDRYRFVPMDIFPSEMLERLEIVKALTPSMEGDAIGGTMNLVMKSAPDRFIFSANASGGYSTLFSTQPFSSFPHGGINKQSPAEINGNSYAANPSSDFTNSNMHYSNVAAPVNSTFGFTIGDRFLNKKLGIILSASYQNFYKGSTSERLIPDAQPLTSPSANTPSFSDDYIRQYSTRTNRIGLQNKIDYVFNRKNKISLFNMYLHQNDFESRYTPDTTVGLNSSATQSQLSIENRSTWQIQDIYNATLHGEHQLSDKVKFDWSGVYSIAKKQLPDQSYYQFDATVTKNDGKISSIDSTIASGSNTVNHVWQHNTDQDLAGYLNLTYSPTILNRVVEFEGGGLYRYKTRTNYYNEYQLQSDVARGTPFTSLDALPLQFETTDDAKGITTAINANSYTAHEKIAAGYIQAKFMLFKALQLLGGVRVENTQQDYTTVMPLTFSGAYGTIHYTDVLPSVHFKYALNDRQNVRLSYFKSISRPGFGEIVPYSYPGEDFTNIGNPNLKHIQADNLDLRYEWFGGLADQLLVGAFYKHIANPIEYFVTRDASPSSLYIQPQNAGNANNYGFEGVFTKFFGMFGVSANYTYTHSAITTTKLLYHVVPGAGTITSDTTQTRPLQGQANNIGNLSLLFKDPKIGLDIQLAFVYTGERIAQVSQYYGLDIWQKPFSQLDLSFEKRLAKRFSFYAKVNNLTNSPNKEFIKTPYSVVNGNFQGGYTIPFQDAGSNYTVTQKDLYKLSFLGGFRYKF
jgi:outer membrane receptor protein involved in Fe transport